MLLLLFYVGDDCYALEARHILEVIPLVPLKSIHQASNGIAGCFQYRERLVPVLDLKQLFMNQDSRSQFSTRIILIQTTCNTCVNQVFGLIAERVTETIQAPERELVKSGIAALENPYLGKLMVGDQGLIQQIQIEGLLPILHQVQLSGTTETDDIGPKQN